MSIQWLRHVLIILLLLALPTSAFGDLVQGDLINVDFDGHTRGEPPATYVGPAAIGAAGDFWNSVDVVFNSVPSATLSNLKTSDGVTVTDVELTVEVTNGRQPRRRFRRRDGQRSI